MSNPARDLAQLLGSWDVESSTVVAARGGGGPGDRQFWRTQAQAVNYLEAIDRALVALETEGHDVSDFAAALPDWYRAVFSYYLPWSSGPINGAAIDVNPLALLRSCALVLDLAAVGMPLSASQLDLLREALDDASTVLMDELQAIPEQERLYVATLTAALANALASGGPLDAEQLKSTIDQLVGALVAIAAQLSAAGNDDGSQRILNIVRKVTGATRTFLYDAAALSAVVAAVPIVQKMIEG